MIFKFNEGEIFRQTVIAYPRYNWTYIKTLNTNEFRTYLNLPIYTGIAASIREDSFNKTEINVDRTGSNVVYPFIDKTSGDFYFNTYGTDNYNELPFGGRINGTHLEYSSIFRDYISSTSNPVYKSLKNIYNSQRKLSEDFNFDNFPISCSVHIIPQQYYQSTIRKGSVSANIISISGSGNLAQNETINIIKAQDIYKDGVLRIVQENIPSSSQYSNLGTKVGYVLYDYGVILFKSSTVWHYDSFSGQKTVKTYINAPAWNSGSVVADDTAYNWKFFGDEWFSQEEENKVHCSIEYEGVNKLQHLTMFCTAPTGKVNCSTNPTFIEFSQSIFLTQSSAFSYNENNNLTIKNTVSSSYNIEENFEKEVYISEIYIYDDDQELIAVAKLANPIKKKEASAFTFKLESMI